MKEFLSQKGIEHAYFDISLDIGALKRFLKIRDTSLLYDKVKERGGIGIPTVIVDDEIFIDPDKEELLKFLG